MEKGPGDRRQAWGRPREARDVPDTAAELPQQIETLGVINMNYKIM